MKKSYTYGYTKSVSGTITVRANSDDEATQEAYAQLEEAQPGTGESEIEVTLLDLKDVEPAYA